MRSPICRWRERSSWDCFGRKNLEIVKHEEYATMEAFVPSMLLQPIVENCLKHGLSSQIGRKKNRVAHGQPRRAAAHRDCRQRRGHFRREAASGVRGGIGLTNVRERLRMLCGTEFHLNIQSRPGEGTVIQIEIPELVVAKQEVRT
jgi:sensor histidine kinase YesM